MFENIIFLMLYNKVRLILFLVARKKIQTMHLISEVYAIVFILCFKLGINMILIQLVK